MTRSIDRPEKSKLSAFDRLCLRAVASPLFVPVLMWVAAAIFFMLGILMVVIGLRLS